MKLTPAGFFAFSLLAVTFVLAFLFPFRPMNLLGTWLFYFFGSLGVLSVVSVFTRR